MLPGGIIYKYIIFCLHPTVTPTGFDQTIEKYSGVPPKKFFFILKFDKEVFSNLSLL
jgi:hypothetical protein